MADRTALVLRRDSWVPVEFDDIKAGDLFVLVEPDGTEAHDGAIAFAVTDATEQPPPAQGSVQAIDLAKITKDQCIDLVKAVRRRAVLEIAEGHEAQAILIGPGAHPRNPERCPRCNGGGYEPTAPGGFCPPCQECYGTGLKKGSTHG